MSIGRLAAWLLVLWLAAGMAHAADYLERENTRFPIPDHYQLINDYENLIDVPRRVALEARLQALERRNGTQIVFLSVPNTGTEGIRAYALSVAQKWDIGNNGQGNGILFLFGRGESHILTGAGIAGAVPDVLVKRLFEEILVPAAERDQLSEGIERTLDALIKACEGEKTLPTAYDYERPNVPLIEDPKPKAERIAIAVLSAIAAIYAGVLLWRRIRIHRARKA